MSASPFFSIVIPLYNKEHHINETLNSVFEQSFGCYEIIVVDDGSTDNSVEAIEHIKDGRLRLIRQENQGVSVARNTGLEHANAPFVAFLDADDTWMPNFLEVVHSLIAFYPGADMFVTNYRVILPGGKTRIAQDVPEEEVGVKRSYWEELLRPYDFVWTSASVFRTTAVQTAGAFRPGERIGQDLDLWSRIAQLNPAIAYSGKVCVNYNRGAENNARTRVRIANPQAFLKTLEFEYGNPDRCTQEKIAIASKYRKKKVALIYTTILAGERRQARILLRSWKIGRSQLLFCMLFFASFLPVFIHRRVYNVRMRVF